MNKLNELKSIVKRLSSEEQKTLQRYLHCFDAVNVNADLKSERLFELILHEEHDKIRLFEKKFSKSAFSMMVTRLHEKVLDSLSFDLNIKRKDAYNELLQAKFTIKKKYIYAQILGSKNLIEECIAQYETIISTAKKFEMYDDLIQALNDLSNLALGTNNLDELSRIGQELDYYEAVRTYYQKSLRIYNQLNVIHKKSPDNVNVVMLFENAISELEECYNKSNSAMVGWIYYHFKIKHASIVNNTELAEMYCTELLDIQRQNPSVGSNSQIGNTYYLLAQNNIANWNFGEALISSVKAQAFFKHNAMNHKLATEIEFYSNFYLGNYTEARFIMNNLIQNTENELSEFDYSFRNYMMACVNFADGRIKEVNSYLTETREIEKDKEGFNISVRLLNLMRLLENQAFDPADSNVESLRKHISRLMKDNEIKPRYVTILKVLRDLVNQNFDYAEIFRTRRQYFEMLNDDSNSEQGWKLLSSELIPFHIWFESKVNNISFEKQYKLHLEQKRMAKEYYRQAV